MKPKIVSLGYAVPDQVVSQDKAFEALGYTERRAHAFKRIFMKAGIEKRHFWVPVEKIIGMEWQGQCEEYQKGAFELSRKAVVNCFDKRLPALGCIVFSSCTGFAPGPTIPQLIASRFGLDPTIEIFNLSGHGCAGGYPGLKVATHYVSTTGKQALVIACELCSCSFYPKPYGRPDPENDYEVLRADAIFADAASAALVGFDDNPRHPVIVDSESYWDARYINDLGFKWREGRLRVLLSKRVPQLAPEVVKPAVSSLLNRNSLSLSSIEWFIIHAAGHPVLDNIRDSLGIPEEKLRLSRETLRQFGNCSSATVGITAKMMMGQNLQPGQYILVVNVGPGMLGGATLLHFGEGK